MSKNPKLPALLKNVLLPIFVLLLGFSFAEAQSNSLSPDVSGIDAEQEIQKTDAASATESETYFDPKAENAPAVLHDLIKLQTDKSFIAVPNRIGDESENKEKFAKLPARNPFSETKIEAEQAQIEEKEKFHWKPALAQSGIFLGFQHAFRMTQHKTRRELDGKFFPDWAQSVKSLRGWNDQDNLFTNYVAHPLQGGLTGRIFVNNSERAAKQEFGKSKKYWESRFKAMAWSAVWSTQFELGPVSEASIGNVGIREKNGGPTMTWGDLVVTPTLGTGVLIAEDAIDKYILKNWLEKKMDNKLMLKIFRVVLTPTTSVGNILRIKKPSWRAGRPL